MATKRDRRFVHHLLGNRDRALCGKRPNVVNSRTFAVSRVIIVTLDRFVDSKHVRRCSSCTARLASPEQPATETVEPA